MPRKVKYRKQQRGKMGGLATSGNTISFGRFALIACQRGWLTSRQIEAARRSMTRYIKREGKIWIRIFPAKPVTRKGTEVPMGGGKGSVEFYVFPIKPGRIIFELEGVKEEVAREALKKAADKLPVKTKFIKR